MSMRAVLLSLRQLAEPATLRILLLTILLTLLLFALFGAALWVALRHLLLPRIAAADDGTLAAALAIGGMVIAGWLLFRAVAMLVIGLFTDGIVASVEEAHYPAAAAQARPVSLATGLRLGLRSARRAIGWNLLAAPFYLALLGTGIGPFALALLVNAVLLGRDFEAIAAARHPAAGERPLTASQRWLLGGASALLFVIPFANLVAPVFGAALAVHLLNSRRESMP